MRIRIAIVAALLVLPTIGLASVIIKVDGIDAAGSRKRAESHFANKPGFRIIHAGDGLPPDLAAQSAVPILGGFAGPTEETADVWTWTPYAIDVRKRGTEDKATAAVAGPVHFEEYGVHYSRPADGSGEEVPLYQPYYRVEYRFYREGVTLPPALDPSMLDSRDLIIRIDKNYDPAVPGGFAETSMTILKNFRPGTLGIRLYDYEEQIASSDDPRLVDPDAQSKVDYINGGGTYVTLPKRPDTLYPMKGTHGGDVLEGTPKAYLMNGYGGDDTLVGSERGDVLDGGEGIDTADFRRSEAAVVVSLAERKGRGGHAEGDSLYDIENVVGSDFDDSLVGDAGENALRGGPGDDMLSGYSGIDELTGGPGDDTFFVYATGNAVTITDFAAGAGSEDRIDLGAFPAFASIRDVLDRTYDDRGDVMIELGPRDIIRLKQLSKSDLDAEDFHFARPSSHDASADVESGKPCDARRAMHEDCKGATVRNPDELVDQVFHAEAYLADCDEAAEKFNCRSAQIRWIAAVKRVDAAYVKECLSGKCAGAVALDERAVCLWTGVIDLPEELLLDRTAVGNSCEDFEFTEIENEFRIRLFERTHPIFRENTRF